MGKDNLTSLLNEMLRAPATRAHYFYDRLDEAGLIAYAASISQPEKKVKS